jgi:hypothetical protein
MQNPRQRIAMPTVDLSLLSENGAFLRYLSSYLTITSHCYRMENLDYLKLILPNSGLAGAIYIVSGCRD